MIRIDDDLEGLTAFIKQVCFLYKDSKHRDPTAEELAKLIIDHYKGNEEFND